MKSSLLPQLRIATSLDSADLMVCLKLRHRLAITDFDTFLFLQIGGSPSSMSNPPNTHPPSSNLSFLKTPPPLPLQNFKKKKERRPRK